MTPAFLITFLIPPLLLTLLYIDFAAKFGRLRDASFVRHLAFIIRNNLPLTQSLMASSQREPAGTRGPLRRLSRMIASGIPLGDAIDAAWPQCPAVDKSIMQAAEKSGTLPDAMTIISARYERRSCADMAGDRFSIAIPLISCNMCLLCLVIFGVFIVPKFITIMEDFAQQMPQFTSEVLMSGLFSDRHPETWYGILFHGAIAAILILIVIWGVTLLVGALVRRLEFLGRFADSIRWRFPFFRRAAIADGCIHSLPSIRIAASAGWPLDRAIDLAATIKTNHVWRKRIQSWADGVRNGMEAASAGRAARLPQMLIRYVATAARDHDFEAPLFAAEQYFVLLLDRQRRALRMSLAIAATLFAGLLVACICVAILLMLSTLIDAAAGQWWDI